jgi:hypothetical protein
VKKSDSCQSAIETDSSAASPPGHEKVQAERVVILPSPGASASVLGCVASTPSDEPVPDTLRDPAVIVTESSNGDSPAHTRSSA